MRRPEVLLASQSAVRASLLRDAGVVIRTASPGVDEDEVKRAMAGRSPADIAAALADRKAMALAREPGVLVIGADQTLEFDGELHDKAPTLKAARERLAAMRGRTHQLHAAVAVAREGQVIWRNLVSASLTMRNFSDAFLDAYLQENEACLSSVGCYQLEKEGAQLFSEIDGDYFAILGLPLIPLLEVLRREGALAA